MRVELKERERTGVRSYSLPASHGFEILEGAASGKQWRDVYWGWGTPKVVIQMLLFSEEPAHCCVHITHVPDAHSWSLFFFFLMLCSIPIDPSWIGSFFCSLFWVYFQSHWRGRPRILPSMLGLAFTHQLIPKQVASLPWEQLTLVTAEHQLGAFKNPGLCTQIELSYVMSLLSQVIDAVGQTLPWY